MIGNSLDELVEFDDQYENAVLFRPREAFEVDGVVYDPDFVTHTSHPIVEFRGGMEHECRDPNECGFDWGTEAFEHSGGDAYRWYPGMVYYRSTEFDTPPKGGR